MNSIDSKFDQIMKKLGSASSTQQQNRNQNGNNIGEVGIGEGIGMKMKIKKLSSLRQTQIPPSQKNNRLR